MGQKDWRDCHFDDSKVVILSEKNGDYIAVCYKANSNAGVCKHALCRTCYDDGAKKAGRRPKKNPNIKIVCCHAVQDLSSNHGPVWWCQKVGSRGEWNRPDIRLFAPLGCVKCERMFVWVK